MRTRGPVNTRHAMTRKSTHNREPGHRRIRTDGGPIRGRQCPEWLCPPLEPPAETGTIISACGVFSSTMNTGEAGEPSEPTSAEVMLREAEECGGSAWPWRLL